MIKRIHVNQHNIKANAKDSQARPVITVKTYKSNHYGHQVEVEGPCHIIYRPEKPLDCGAKVWIETQGQVKIIDHSKPQPVTIL